MDRLTKAQMEFMNGYVPATIHDIYEYAKGGGIHIKESKKGTFTAAATKHGKSVQAFASQVLANKDDYSPAMVKKANFARNASKWKHQDGGATSGQDELIQQIAQALQKGAKPEKILEELVKMGISQEEATQTIQAIMKQMQGAQMQEGGPTPQELTGQEQPQGGQQDAQQLMQGIQQALQQGATPEEVIAQLLQEQIDPQMIVQIFVQLGMPQKQVVQVVESVMQQMGGGQEQEVPQEQMQEQGMEQPMQEASQESMEYGGVPQYPYGGLYANDYAANFMPDSKTNRFLTNTNMLSDPSLNYKTQGMAAAGFEPAIAYEGIKGIASMFAGSAAGYKGAFNKLFGNKNKPGEITTPQAQAYHSKYFKDKGDSFAKKMENKYFDTPKINPYGQNTSIPSIATPSFNPNKKSFSSFKFEDGGTPNNPGFNALPEYVQDKIIANMQIGGAYKIKDEREEANTASDNTRTIKPKFTDIKKTNVRNKTNKEIAAERKNKIERSVAAQKEDIIGNSNWRDVLARETSAIPEKLRFSLEPNVIDDSMFNPIQMIASMATNLGQAPLQSQQEDSYLPYVTSIGAPLLTGALAGIGAKGTKQFVNNLVNPAAGISLKNLPSFSKKINNAESNGYRLVDYDDLTPKETFAHIKEGRNRTNPFSDELHELRRATEDGEAWKYADLDESIKIAKEKAHQYREMADAEDLINRIKNRNPEAADELVYYQGKDITHGRQELKDFIDMPEGNQGVTFNSKNDNIYRNKNNIYEIDLDDYFGDPQFKNLDDIKRAGQTNAGEYFKKRYSPYRGKWNNLLNNKYGGLAKAQVGIPPGFDFNDPFGMQSPRFGQTANNADTKGYTDEKYIPQYNYSTPGFVEGMGVGQEGYGGADNTRYDSNDPNAPTAASIKLYNDQQALGSAGQNTISLTDEQVANKKGKYDGYAFPKNAPETYKGKANPKTLNTSNAIGVSGNTMFTNSMTALGATSNFIDLFDTDPETLQKRAIKKANEDYMNSLTYNPTNPFGERTPNAGILKPNRHIATQDIGSSQFSRYGGATRYANGGQMQYQQGGEYHVTHDELLQLMRNGAEVEFL